MTLPFVKLVGAGNDFVFVHESDLAHNLERPSFATKICDRNFGVGADGFVIISKMNDEENSYSWDFYNSDGSSAEMCGNAARCCVRYIYEKFGESNCRFKTLAGIITGKLIGTEASVQWHIESSKTKELGIDLENFKSFNGHFINTGVPHFVIVNKSKELTWDDCLAIQKHPHFGQAQTNVTLLDIEKPGFGKTKTFERGVCDFTLACGTGVIASAIVLETMNKKDTYQLEAPGGVLKVKLEKNLVTLIGPTELTFRGDYSFKKD